MADGNGVNDGVRFTVKEMFYDIGQKLSSIDDKLDTKADKSEVDALKAQVQTNNGKIGILEERQKTSDEKMSRLTTALFATTGSIVAGVIILALSLRGVLS